MSFTPNKNLEEQAHNANVNAWDTPLNDNFGKTDLAFGGSTTLNATGATGNVAFTQAQATPPTIIVSGLPIADVVYRLPSGVGGVWSVSNVTTGGFAISFISLAGGSAVEIPVGINTMISCDGTSRGMVLASELDPTTLGLFPISSVTANGSSPYASFTDLIAGDYLLRVRGLKSVGDGSYGLQFSIDNGANWLGAANYNALGYITYVSKTSATGPVTGSVTTLPYSGGAGETYIDLGQRFGSVDTTAGTAGFTADINISIVSGLPSVVNFTGSADCVLSGDRTWQNYVGSGNTYSNTTLKNAMRVISASVGGNLNVGTMALYRYSQ